VQKYLQSIAKWTFTKECKESRIASPVLVHSCIV